VRAVGVHGALTGGRVDRLIVDDILDPENCDTDNNRKKLESWYRAVAAGRLTGRAQVLVVGTAYHSQDLLHTIALQKNFKWFRFPVIRADGSLSWEEQWPLARINERRADLAAAQNRKSDKCAFFTFLEDAKGNRRVLNIEHGKFTGPDILRMLADIHNRYHSFLIVESNACQQFILQFAQEGTNLPTIPFNTGAAKWDPRLGVEGLAVELFNCKWIFPNQAGVCTPEMEAFITQMLFYSPRAHTGDILMASYFARDFARRTMHHTDVSGGTASCRILGEDATPALERIPFKDTGFGVMED
jgi:hypothetical protein